MFFLSFLFLNLLFSCSNDKIKYSDESNSNSGKKENFYEGRIAVIGNEPFTKLGLVVNDTMVYTLECDKVTKDSLLSSQGKLFKIYTSNNIESDSNLVLTVSKFQQIVK